MSEDTQKKRGRFSVEDIKFIRTNHLNMSVDELADKLNREYDTVKAQLVKLGLTGDANGELLYDMEFELENREYYSNIVKQFTSTELKLFKYLWIKIIAQFNNDVLPTEELQIVDTIKMEIMMNRCLNKQKESLDAIEMYRAELVELSKLEVLEQADKARMAQIGVEIANLHAADDAAGNQYRNLQKEKNSLFEKIKGVRAERVKKIENNKITFNSLLARLITDTNFRKECGERMELHRLATIDEEVRLAAYHKYEDGEIDQVLLTPDTVKDDHIE